MATQASQQMEQELEIRMHRGTQSITPVTQGIGYLEALPEHVCPMEDGQGVSLHAIVSNQLMDWYKDTNKNQTMNNKILA